MKASVILCTYSNDMYEAFSESANSILNQTYPDVELVIIVDGNKDLFHKIKSEYGGEKRIQIHCNEENLGLLKSRNKGADLANGEVVAFIDDDAIADNLWIEELVKTYKEEGVEAAGGKMTPLWVAGKPSFLPEEFYWLVGVTHKGFPEEGEVRNTFGSNISFRKEVFQELGGFNTDIGGRKGEKNLQGGETELCARLRDELGGRVYYNPNAEVAHRVFQFRTEIRWLLSRAFWQGYSKRAMETLVPDEGIEEEGSYLRYLLIDATVRRLKETVLGPSSLSFVHLIMIHVFTACVAFGYLYGSARWR